MTSKLLDRIDWQATTGDTVETEILGTRFRVQRVADATPATHPWRLLELVGWDDWRDGGYVFETAEAAQGYLADFMREEGVLAPSTAPLFTGDWEHNDTLTAWEVAYPAVRYGNPWNGFATPVVTRNVLAALVARNEFMRHAGHPDLCRMVWDGDTVLVMPFDVADDDPEADEYRTVLLPHADGTYDLGTLGWTFVLVEDTDNVVRTVTA
jgi:hypothetical protein